MEVNSNSAVYPERVCSNSRQKDWYPNSGKYVTAVCAPVTADTTHLRSHATIVGLFFVGGVLGAAGYLAIGFYALLPAAMLLFVIALPHLIDDFRDGAVVSGWRLT